MHNDYESSKSIVKDNYFSYFRIFNDFFFHIISILWVLGAIWFDLAN